MNLLKKKPEHENEIKLSQKNHQNCSSGVKSNSSFDGRVTIRERFFQF